MPAPAPPTAPNTRSRSRSDPMSAHHPPVRDWATDFDHTDPEWVADPYPIWDELREPCPVAHSDRYGGVWLPVRHDDVAEVAYDTEHFTSRSVIVSETRPGPLDLPAPIGIAPPITSDPPFHQDARRLLLPAFAPKPIAALEPFTRELCRELLAETDGARDLRRRGRLRAAHSGARDREDARLPPGGRRHLPPLHPPDHRGRRHAGRGARRRSRSRTRSASTSTRASPSTSSIRRTI